MTTRVAASGALPKPSLIRVIVVGHSRRMVWCPCLLLHWWVFTMGSEVNGIGFTSDQGITYNMAAHMVLELSVVP